MDIVDEIFKELEIAKRMEMGIPAGPGGAL